ncbi:helix-turn-helix transcriptional regulator [Aquamicrobium sp. LC103]|nr:helix-turn-helix transcriptional regulator [Aquamicrobium sp. LC103]
MEGALKVFLAYGFDRTKMDDIARAAEFSRPSLYLLFKNKTDIYRAIASCLLTLSLKRAELALAKEGTLAERLDGLIECSLHDLMKDIVESPHGQEIIDMRSRLAGDIIAEWRGRMDTLIERAVRQEAQRLGADLCARGVSARTVAETLLDALEGMKPRVSDPNDHLEAGKRLVRVIAAAVRP